jgi:hypothetical protein
MGIYEFDYLFDGYRRFPAFLLIQNREAHGARRVHIWVKQGGVEFT